MKSVYDVGILQLLEDDGLPLVIFNSSINSEIIGCYRDKKGIIKRIRRDSEWGKKVLEFYDKSPKRGDGGLQKLHVTFTESQTAFESRKLNPDKSQGSPFVKLSEPPCV